MGNLTTGSGCGSGGSINIACQVFGGNGLLSCGGGSGQYEYPAQWYGGAGGGGRIAVQYASLSSPRAIRFKTSGGLGNERKIPQRLLLAARDGTLWLPDTQFLSETLTSNLFTGVRLYAPGFTNWAVDHLTISNCSVTFPDGFALTVTNDLLIGMTGKLSLAGGTLAVSQGNLRLTNGGALYVSALATNGTPGNPGAKVDVAGDVSLGISSWIYSTADEAAGGGVQFVMKNLNVATNAGFDADGRGYSRGRGPGGGGANTGRGGGGYGGKGSYWSTDPGGLRYGLTNAPLQAGSAGGYGGGVWEQSGYGGGLVWIEASGEVKLNGTLTADGRISGGSSAGGGAGGGILVSCQKFYGASTAKMKADGKNGADWGGGTWYGGGGGGGRIAVWQKVTPAMRAALISSQATPAKVTVTSAPFTTYLGTVSVTNGFGWGDASTNVNDEATVGSVVFLEQLPPSGTLLMFR
jgi:hypothetical protein